MSYILIIIPLTVSLSALIIFLFPKLKDITFKEANWSIKGIKLIPLASLVSIVIALLISYFQFLDNERIQTKKIAELRAEIEMFSDSAYILQAKEIQASLENSRDTVKFIKGVTSLINEIERQIDVLNKKNNEIQSNFYEQSIITHSFNMSTGTSSATFPTLDKIRIDGVDRYNSLIDARNYLYGLLNEMNSSLIVKDIQINFFPEKDVKLQEDCYQTTFGVNVILEANINFKIFGEEQEIPVYISLTNNSESYDKYNRDTVIIQNQIINISQVLVIRENAKEDVKVSFNLGSDFYFGAYFISLYTQKDFKPFFIKSFELCYMESRYRPFTLPGSLFDKSKLQENE